MRYPGYKALLDALRNTPSLLAARHGGAVLDEVHRWTSLGNVDLREASTAAVRDEKTKSRFMDAVNETTRPAMRQFPSRATARGGPSHAQARQAQVEARIRPFAEHSPSAGHSCRKLGMTAPESGEDLRSVVQARVGTVLNDKWTLEKLLGTGGMGAVYEARHRNGARAAVKVLHPLYAREPAVRERFLPRVRREQGRALGRGEGPGR